MQRKFVNMLNSTRTKSRILCQCQLQGKKFYNIKSRNLPSLEKLKLDDNLIERLEDRSFTDLYSLKELHLDHNLLEDVSERAFDRIPSIR